MNRHQSYEDSLLFQLLKTCINFGKIVIDIHSDRNMIKHRIISIVIISINETIYFWKIN